MRGKLAWRTPLPACPALWTGFQSLPFFHNARAPLRLERLHMNGSAGYTAAQKNRIMWVIFVTIFLDMIGFGMVFPLMPFYVKQLGGNSETYGLLLSSFSVMQLIATPMMGRLSDRFGRRPVILLSLFGNALSMVLFALANQLWMIFVSRLVAGLTAGNMGACQAVIADVTNKEDRAAAMGKMGAGIGLGMVMGPLFGSALAGFGIWAPALVAAGAALLDLALAYFLMPETRPATSPQEHEHTRRAEADSEESTWARVGKALREPQLLMVMGITFFSFFCLTNIQSSMALLGNERLGWGEKEVGRIFAIFGGITLLVQGVAIGRLVKMVGETTLVRLGAALLATGQVVVVLADSTPNMLSGIAIIAMGLAVTNPVTSSLASRYAPGDLQGTVLGVTQSAGGLARAVGPTIGGYLFHRMGSSSPFMLGVAMALASLGLGLALRQQKSQP